MQSKEEGKGKMKGERAEGGREEGNGDGWWPLLRVVETARS